MEQGGKFYNASRKIDGLKETLENNGYRIWNTGTQTLITGDYMPPYGEILDDRIVTLVDADPETSHGKRIKDLKKLEKILEEF